MFLLTDKINFLSDIIPVIPSVSEYLSSRYENLGKRPWPLLKRLLTYAEQSVRPFITEQLGWVSPYTDKGAENNTAYTEQSSGLLPVSNNAA